MSLKEDLEKVSRHSRTLVLRRQITISHPQLQPAVVSSLHHMLLSAHSWELGTLNPGHLYLRRILFHSGETEGWPAPQPCGLLDNSVLVSLEAAPCKGRCSMQNASEANVLLCAKGQHPSAFRRSSSAPSHWWQAPKVEVCLCLNHMPKLGL